MTWIGAIEFAITSRIQSGSYPRLASWLHRGRPVRLLDRIERAMGWASSFNPETARAVLGTMAASMFTFIVFVSSALLVAVQLASSLLTPRIIAIVFRDRVTRFSLTVFVFTFTFTLATLVRIDDSVPLVTSEVAAYSCLASLGVFLYLIDHVGKALRPSGALRSVALLGARSSRMCIRGAWLSRKIHRWRRIRLTCPAKRRAYDREPQ